MKALGWTLLALCSFTSAAFGQAAGAAYKCPGNPPTYTNLMTPEQAKSKGCRTLEGVPVTVIQGTAPRKLPPPVAAAGPRPAGERVDPADQRARDSEARRILEAELKREEERLAALRAEYNNGEPERQGSERNYQRYLDRVAQLKDGIERKEADVAAIKRELAKLPPSQSQPQ
jgi:hypothetical protein